MNHRHAAFAALLATLASCASPAPTTPHEVLAPRDLTLLQHHQRVFRLQNSVPQVFDFPGHGRVTVREVTLDGFPGNAYVRCKFTYENRTEEPIVQSWVMLDVLDGEGRTVATQGTVCIIPVPVPIARGSFVSDELRTRTHGVHLQKGWSWRIRCVAQRQNYDPLDPPVPERTWPRLPPMIIKNRGQNDAYAAGDYTRDARGFRIAGGR